MSENNDTNQERNQRIVRHMKALQNGYGDDDAYRAALNGVRDDHSLTDDQRGAIYKTLAQQSLIWYIEAGTGEPYNVETLSEKLQAAIQQS